jgi:hypothetical protein
MFRRIILVPAALIALMVAVVSFSALTGAGTDGISGSRVPTRSPRRSRASSRT